MTNTLTQKILIITNSNIFYECIKRILIFTLKTEFIQSDHYDTIFQHPGKISHIDMLILDYRFRQSPERTIIDNLIDRTGKRLGIQVFAGPDSNLDSSDSVQVIRSDTKLDLTSDVDGTFINLNKGKSKYPNNALTKKENIIAGLISKGLNNKQIAKKQNISEKTVKAHLTNIYRKLKLKNRFELMLNTNRAS